MNFATFTRAILRHRGVASVALLTVVVAVTSGVLRLNADFSVRAFFPVNDAETTYLADYQERWGEDDLLLVTLDASPAGEDASLLTRDRLQQIEGLCAALDAVEGVSRVLSVARVPRVNRGIAGTFVPVPLLGTAPKVDLATADDAARARVEAWRQKVLSDPAVVPAYLSDDGSLGAILVALDVDTSDLAMVRPVVHAIEAVVQRHPLAEDPDVSVLIAGVPAIRADVLDVIVKDQIVLVPVAGALMGLLLLVLFRSRHGVLIPALAAGVPLVMLLGLMGWTGEAFGLLNQVLLALVPAIAVADAIHLISRFHEASRSRAPDGELSEADRDEAIVEAMQFMGVACFLTSFTTIVGFLSLLTTDLPVLRGFGLYAAAGVGLAYFTVLFIVPLALQFTRSSARKLDHGTDGLIGSMLQGAAHLTTRRPWVALALTALLAVGAAVAGAGVQVDTKVTQTFSPEHPTTRGNTLVDERLGGVLQLEYDLSGPAGAFDDPAVLAAISEAEVALKALPTVRDTVSPAALLRFTSVLVGGPRAVPTDASVVQRLYRFAEDSGAVDHLVNAERDRARLLVRSVDVGAVGFLALGESLNATVAAALDPVGVSAHLTGDSYVAYRGLSQVTSDLRDSLVLAFAVIGLIIAGLFRSVRLGLLSLPPNAVPLLLGYGAMGLFGWALEPAPAVVFTVAIGVSVDSAIHLIARFREERAEGLSVDEAVTAAVHHSGRAVTITAIILVVGFAVNMASSSPANASFGKLGTLIIAAALLSNLVVLPAMLVVGYRKA